MTDAYSQIIDSYSPNKRVQKRLDTINKDPNKISYEEVLAILEYKDILNKDSALTKDEVKQIVDDIEKNNNIARSPPSSRTIKNRLDELAKKELVFKDESPDPYKYWKIKEENVNPLYYWYVDRSVRKIDPYIKKIIYPHTISSLGIFVYIVITFPIIIESFDVLLLLLLIGFYSIGHLAAYLGEMKVN